MKKVLIGLLMTVLALAISIPAAIAAPVGPDLEQVVTYYAKPDVPPGQDKKQEPKQVPDYWELMGPSWDLSGYPAGIDYVIDPDGAPAGAVSEIAAAFEAWDAATSAELFNDVYDVDSTVNPSLDLPDGVNTVTWRPIQEEGVVAVTYVWFRDWDGSESPSPGDEIVEFEMIFNDLLPWGIDPDGEGRKKMRNAYDVRNVGTHETGHVVGLDDLYHPLYKELTMYGYTKTGETKKISLEIGDIHGCQELYGE